MRNCGARRDGSAIYGCRRRAGDRLRRLADGFRIERELHAAGIRERRGVSHPECVRRIERAASDDCDGERAAIAAYHSVLVFNVLGVSGMGDEEVAQELAGDPEQPLIDLQETFRSVNQRNLLEAYHDAQQALDSALNLFSLDICRWTSGALRRICTGRFAGRFRSWRGSWIFIRRAGRHRRDSFRYLFLQFSLFQSMRTAGRSSSYSPSCRFTGWKKSRRSTQCWAI